MNIQEYHRGDYVISTDPARLDVARIHTFLTQLTYWAKKRTIETVQKSIEHSINFGVYCGDEQVGYARVVTDYATFAWLCDVIITPEHRGKGLGKWIVEVVTTHPQIEPLRRLLLATLDAHELYRRYGGFVDLANPERWMEKVNPNL
jgi:GNAT superfamily N-acetyltransferase